MTRYILLCRHGPHRKGSLTKQQLDGEPVYPTDLIGERLREQLDNTRGGQARIRIAQIWVATTQEATATLRHLITALGRTSDDALTAAADGSGSKIPIRRMEELAPQHFLETPTEDNLVPQLRDCPHDHGGNATLVVGHQPQLSWIADRLLRAGRLRRKPPVPIDRAGLVCIALEGRRHRRARLAWAISFDDQAVAQEVREKIRLKMDTAKLLTGALTLGLTVIFGVLFDNDQVAGLAERRWAVQASAVLLMAAAALYFATMYAYDGLLMPDRFWGERRPASQRRWFNRDRGWLVQRPPSSTAWVLYQNMMRVWRNLFSSASLLVGAGIALLGYGALRLKPWTALWLVVPAVAIALWVRWSQPVLGSED
jgi:hypothetical protein